MQRKAAQSWFKQGNFEKKSTFRQLSCYFHGFGHHFFKTQTSSETLRHQWLGKTADKTEFEPSLLKGLVGMMTQLTLK